MRYYRYVGCSFWISISTRDQSDPEGGSLRRQLARKLTCLATRVIGNSQRANLRALWFKRDGSLAMIRSLGSDFGSQENNKTKNVGFRENFPPQPPSLYPMFFVFFLPRRPSLPRTPLPSSPRSALMLWSRFPAGSSEGCFPFLLGEGASPVAIWNSNRQDGARRFELLFRRGDRRSRHDAGRVLRRRACSRGRRAETRRICRRGRS